MNGILTIPKGKDILDFLQELDGTDKRTENAWLFMHKNVVENLMNQSKNDVISPALLLAKGDCSFSLHYKGSSECIGAIAFQTTPCYDANHQAPWFIVTAIYLEENSPIQIAFRKLPCYPSEAIFLTLEE